MSSKSRSTGLSLRDLRATGAQNMSGYKIGDCAHRHRFRLYRYGAGERITRSENLRVGHFVRRSL